MVLQPFPIYFLLNKIVVLLLLVNVIDYCFDVTSPSLSNFNIISAHLGLAVTWDRSSHLQLTAALYKLSSKLGNS